MKRQSVLPLLLAMLLLSACGGGGSEDGPTDKKAPRTPTSSPPPPAASPALVAWMGKFCASDHALSLPYPVLPKEGTPVDRKELQTFLIDTINELDKSKKAMAALPPAPTASAKSLLTRYRKDVDKLDKGTTKHLGEAMAFPEGALEDVRVVSGIEVISFRGFTGYLKGHADLEAANKQAKAC